MRDPGLRHDGRDPLGGGHGAQRPGGGNHQRLLEKALRGGPGPGGRGFCPGRVAAGRRGGAGHAGMRGAGGPLRPGLSAGQRTALQRLPEEMRGGSLR